MIKELDINSTFGNPTYTPNAQSNDEILPDYASVFIPVSKWEGQIFITMPILDPQTAQKLLQRHIVRSRKSFY
jgi:hypothetical protein